MLCVSIKKSHKSLLNNNDAVCFISITLKSVHPAWKNNTIFIAGLSAASPAVQIVREKNHKRWQCKLAILPGLALAIEMSILEESLETMWVGKSGWGLELCGHSVVSFTDPRMSPQAAALTAAGVARQHVGDGEGTNPRQHHQFSHFAWNPSEAKANSRSDCSVGAVWIVLRRAFVKMEAKVSWSWKHKPDPDFVVYINLYDFIAAKPHLCENLCSHCHIIRRQIYLWRTNNQSWSGLGYTLFHTWSVKKQHSTAPA